ncbi:MAG: hypothetical protein ABI598_05375 [Chloroflexota bacterium]
MAKGTRPVSQGLESSSGNRRRASAANRADVRIGTGCRPGRGRRHRHWHLQVGDQTAADGAADAADPEEVGAEAAGAEASGTEAIGAESDGPGGHADDPSDANADHQYGGEE